MSHAWRIKSTVEGFKVQHGYLPTYVTISTLGDNKHVWQTWATCNTKQKAEIVLRALIADSKLAH